MRAATAAGPGRGWNRQRPNGPPLALTDPHRHQRQADGATFKVFSQNLRHLRAVRFVLKDSVKMRRSKYSGVFVMLGRESPPRGKKKWISGGDHPAILPARSEVLEKRHV